MHIRYISCTYHIHTHTHTEIYPSYMYTYLLRYISITAMKAHSSFSGGSPGSIAGRRTPCEAKSTAFRRCHGSAWSNPPKCQDLPFDQFQPEIAIVWNVCPVPMILLCRLSSHFHRERSPWPMSQEWSGSGDDSAMEKVWTWQFNPSILIFWDKISSWDDGIKIWYGMMILVVHGYPICLMEMTHGF